MWSYLTAVNKAFLIYCSHKFTCHIHCKKQLFSRLLYSEAEPYWILFSIQLFHPTFLWNSTCYEAPQPLYQNICCPPKGLLTFIIVSSGLLSLFILLCSFVPQHFYCFPTEQPPGASVEHKHSKVTAGLMVQWNPSPHTVGSVFPYGTSVEVSVRIKFWKRVRLLCEVTVI